MLKRSRGEILHFFIIPIVIGSIGGFSAIFFRKLIDFFSYLYNIFDIYHSNYFYILTMPFLFWVSNLLINKFLIDKTNVTIDNIAKKISLMSGKFSYIKGLFVLFLSSLSIGFGAPVGREAPIAKMGGILSEIFLKLTKTQRIDLPIFLSAGISAAIAATFNAPIAGIIFGLEIIIGKINAYIVIPLMVSCVTATAIAREYIGNFTAFYVPPINYDDKYLIFIPFEAIFFSVICIIFLKSIRKFEFLRYKFRRKWSYIVLAIGFLVAVIIIIEPHTKGVGYGFISQLYSDAYDKQDILFIFLLKIVGVVLSFGSGIFGGLMSPSIFIGSFGGYWFGDFFVNFGLDPKVFAIIGSSAMLAGVSKAPLRTSIIMTELTHTYELLLPILIASSITGYLLSKSEPGSYFKRSLIQKGIDLDNKLVENYFEKCDLTKFLKKITPISEDAGIREIRKIFRRYHVRYIPVIKDEKLVGIISLRDYRKKYLTKRRNIKAVDIMSHHPYYIKEGYSSKDIFKALSTLDVNLIPYTNKDGKYLGMIDISRLLKDISLSENVYKIKNSSNI